MQTYLSSQFGIGMSLDRAVQCYQLVFHAVELVEYSTYQLADMVWFFVTTFWIDEVEIDIPADLDASARNNHRARRYVNKPTARTQSRKVQ